MGYQLILMFKLFKYHDRSHPRDSLTTLSMLISNFSPSCFSSFSNRNRQLSPISSFSLTGVLALVFAEEADLFSLSLPPLLAPISVMTHFGR